MKEIDYLLNKKWERVQSATWAIPVWEYTEESGAGTTLGTWHEEQKKYSEETGAGKLGANAFLHNGNTLQRREAEEIDRFVTTGHVEPTSDLLVIWDNSSLGKLLILFNLSTDF